MNFRAQKSETKTDYVISLHPLFKKNDSMKRKLPEMQDFPKSPCLDPATYAQRHQLITFFGC